LDHEEYYRSHNIGEIMSNKKPETTRVGDLSLATVLIAGAIGFAQCATVLKCEDICSGDGVDKVSLLTCDCATEMRVVSP